MKFRKVYLICLDQEKDINYVLKRFYSKNKAYSFAERVMEQYSDIYITVEKELIGDIFEELSEKCSCGKEFGICVGNLKCKCGPLDICKRVDKVFDYMFDPMSSVGSSFDPAFSDFNSDYYEVIYENREEDSDEIEDIDLEESNAQITKPVNREETENNEIKNLLEGFDIIEESEKK